MKKCYLAGPIARKTYDESEQWRDYVKERLPEEIKCYSPLRAKQFLRDHGLIGVTQDTYDENPLATAKGIMTRDHFDCFTSDLILCNLLGATSVSIGTVIEIAFSYAYRKPLVVCIEKGNIHNHPMIREATGYSCDNLDEAIHIVKSILLP